MALFLLPIKFLLTYGYLALFVWSILEGEIGLMLAGWLASEHQLFQYDKVILTAIVGAFIGDHFLFFFGRLFEKRALALLAKNPRQYQKAMAWIKKWGSFVIIFERFIYGTHIPVLLTFGMSGYSYARFLLFDLVGITLWAFTFVTIGYLFGHTVISIVLMTQRYLVALLFLIVAVTIFKRATRRFGSSS